METPVVLFLMAWSLYLTVLDRKMVLAAISILLFLARADTFIWLLRSPFTSGFGGDATESVPS